MIPAIVTILIISIILFTCWFSFSTKYQINKDIIEINAELQAENKRLNTQKEHLTDLIQSENITYEILKQHHAEQTANLTKIYEDMKADKKQSLNEQFQMYEQDFDRKIRSKRDELKDLEDKVSAAIAATIREQEKKRQSEFYKLQLSTIDIEEIKKIRTITPYLRDTSALNKVIYKNYYEHPCNDLIMRVVGQGVHIGIYKITNISNGMCYVGQSVNIGDRFKQHIKKGIGIDTTNNKLYQAMLAEGAENFSFEVIEECTKDKLNEREVYWQTYFKAKEYGYSIK